MLKDADDALVLAEKDEMETTSTETSTAEMCGHGLGVKYRVLFTNSMVNLVPVK